MYFCQEARGKLICRHMQKTHVNEIAVFGGGCFWCTEAVFKGLRGVIAVMPGYAGGTIDNPTNEQVCSGKTGHAEVIRIEFDPSVISYPDLLNVFFATHDPTTMNKQGNDVGTQYRSVIFANSDEQAREAKKVIDELNNSGNFDSPIVTQVEPLTNFYEAEEYHKDYYAKNPAAGYCQMVISPKLAKFRASYKDLLK
ncbi:MAG: Peptide methionine sulfoxide reductase MsrA [Parcubacteria group bacterium GW2011_GWE2_43_12]|nr:MAG: Peptide methionine sulfoxide reductase MsrA [Parcubacteria group bacterium GW2011_GWE2_43_12]